MIDYNYERPHESLNDLPPKIYEQQLTWDYSIWMCSNFGRVTTGRQGTSRYTAHKYSFHGRDPCQWQGLPWRVFWSNWPDTITGSYDSTRVLGCRDRKISAEHYWELGYEGIIVEYVIEKRLKHSVYPPKKATAVTGLRAAERVKIPVLS